MLSKQYRLKKKYDFSYVYKKGTSSPSHSFVFLYVKNHNNQPKFGFVVSKKVGNSVHRNRARRMMREACNSLIADINPSYNYLFIARIGAEKTSFEEMKKQMLNIFIKNNLIVGD